MAYISALTYYLLLFMRVAEVQQPAIISFSDILHRCCDHPQRARMHGKAWARCASRMRHYGYLPSGNGESVSNAACRPPSR